MQHWDAIGLDDFLSTHLPIRISDINDAQLVLAGEYHLRAQLEGSQLVDRIYYLKVIFPRDYPEKLPKVIDEEKYFPRNQEYHTYADGSFCLGSELRIKSTLGNDYSVSAFFERIIDRFSYAVTHRIEFGDFPYGELAHGEQGLIDDYSELFGVKGKSAVLLALKALGKRKREANKLCCPCGCGFRLGRCNFRFSLCAFRKIARRCWFRQHLKEYFTPIGRPKRKSRTSRSRSNTTTALSSLSF